MTDYSKMSDVDIAVRVGKYVSKDGQALVGMNGKACIHEYHPLVGGFGEMCLGWVEFDPCNSWADAGTIATKNRISINAHGRHKWLAWKNKGETLTQMADPKNLLSEICENPCRAICIVFLMMNEGE